MEDPIVRYGAFVDEDNFNEGTINCNLQPCTTSPVVLDIPRGSKDLFEKYSKGY